MTSPRIVNDPDTPECEFRCVDGQIQERFPDSGDDDAEWHALDLQYPSVERIRVWADLLANPNG